MSGDVVLEALEKRWFDLASREDYPNKPEITFKLDRLTQEIKSRKEFLAKEKSDGR